MHSLIDVSVFAIGLIVLYFGAEATLHGSVSLAKSFGISPLIIGLTLVAYGTSAPELSLDVTAAIRGKTDLAFGDLVGSNIANIGLILGVAALFRPLDVRMSLLRAEVPIVIAVSILLWAFSADGEIGRQDGLIMLACFALLAGYTFRSAQLESRSVKSEFESQVAQHGKSWTTIVKIVLGLIGLVLGAQLMVYGAVNMARSLGVSELLIGLTIVAIGTSLPELATAIVAARKGEADIVVGNVLGSNIFNLLCVMAIVAIIRPIRIDPSSLVIELPIMVAFAVALVPIMLQHRRITRYEGGFLVVSFVCFIVWQIVR